MSLGKVTAFITGKNHRKDQLLLISHPHAGIQIPAGTVENGESVFDAVLREVFEETGIQNAQIIREIGKTEKELPESQYVVTETSTVYSRPDPISFGWASIRRGITVNHLMRNENGYCHITYKEHDNVLEPSYITYQITGWIPSCNISKNISRQFFHLKSHEELPDRWTKEADGHTWELFWAPISSLPSLSKSSTEWLAYINSINYHF